ncbi:uncharacterized protein LOC117397339 isoform X3 [Acipenser ruthenus]|nr:uncharacterized protein LOC117397086 isoform X3 [Acipenser ruthenus]XP_058866250.1 uncharacterized protein LOC117397339 isoform X3 [Acipenser ruthenus]
MQFQTTQRREFIPRLLAERTQPAFKKEQYRPPQEPLQGQTVYSLDFPAKQPEALVMRRPKSTMQRAGGAAAKISSTTTARESYQGRRGGPQLRFGELPAIVGSLLYPDQKEEMRTTTQREFIKKAGAKPELIRAVQCNLKIEGERDMKTTHQTVFQPLPLEKALAVPRPRLSEREAALRGAHMESVTKYRSDYPAHHSLPERRELVRPPADNLAINHSLRGDFKTVQRETFPGWDTSKYKRPDPAHFKEELSDREREAHFQGDTVTKLAYQPIQCLGLCSLLQLAYQPIQCLVLCSLLQLAYQPIQCLVLCFLLQLAYQPIPLNTLQLEPIKRPATVLKPHDARFEDTTANRVFFQDWGVQPRVRYGDPYDGSCIRPLGRFETETTNRSTFYQKAAEMVTNCKPEHKPIEAVGEHDFTTVHQETYRPLNLPVCRLQAYLLQQQQMKENTPPAVPS